MNCSVASYSCIENWNGGGVGNISSDPCFVCDDSSDYHLQCDSFCIDAGDPNEDYGQQTDIDGWPRVIGGRIDMGAYEFDPNSPLIKVPSVIGFYGMDGGANPDS